MIRAARFGSFAVVMALASVSRCDAPRAPQPMPEPRPGEFVRIRGTLSEDVDCRLLRTSEGRTFSLSARLPNYLNGTRLCIHGTISEASQCLTQPMIEVQAVRPWSSCP